MAKKIALNEGVIRPSLVRELNWFRAPNLRVSSYYLNLYPQPGATPAMVRIAVKDVMDEHRERIGQLDVSHPVRQSLLHDWEAVSGLADDVIGERNTRALACFVASDADYGRALRLPWPQRDRAFFEDRFVLWPLRQILDQVDRWGIILADKERARLFLFHLEQIEEITDLVDHVPGRFAFPDPFGESHHMHKHVEHAHHHFDNVSELALRLLELEPFEHLILGGRVESLPQFESRLHRYLRDRVVARWEFDVGAPTPDVRDRAHAEEEEFFDRQALDVWHAIQDDRPRRGSLGLDEVTSALWQRRVQTMLVRPILPNAPTPGFRCPSCTRLQPTGGNCVECGTAVNPVPDIYEESVQDALEQAAQVRFWKDPILQGVEFIAAFRRY